MIAPPMVEATAGKTGNSPPGKPYPIMLLSTNRAEQAIVLFLFVPFQGKPMGALLIRNTKIPTGLLPFLSMRSQSATTMTMTCHEMS